MKHVWVVVEGEKNEGGTVRAVCKYRTTARAIKADIQRDPWFLDCDYCIIKKVSVLDNQVLVNMQPWEVGDVAV